MKKSGLILGAGVVWLLRAAIISIIAVLLIPMVTWWRWPIVVWLVVWWLRRLVAPIWLSILMVIMGLQWAIAHSWFLGAGILLFVVLFGSQSWQPWPRHIHWQFGAVGSLWMILGALWWGNEPSLLLLNTLLLWGIVIGQRWYSGHEVW